jgi:hypothetical protein
MNEKKVLIKPPRRTRAAIGATPAPAGRSGDTGTETASPHAGASGVGPRFQFFLIDSGWNTVCARIVRDNLGMITEFQNDDPFYILTREQSITLLKGHPHLIGKDPILMARDLSARGMTRPDDYHGFHLNLGMLWEPNKAAEVLRQFLNFLSMHRDSANIENDIRRRLHRDGLQGAIEVLRSSSEAMLA